MPYLRFEELPVWKDAIELAARILQISQTGLFKGVGDLKSQLERAAISVSNNIAEGYERGTSEELITFLYVAPGSVGEVRSMLHLLDRLPGLDEIATDVNELRRLTESISRQLGGWIEAIKNSAHKGHRSQNDRTRATAQAVRRRDQFLEKVRAIQDEAIRGLRSSPDQDSTPEKSESQYPVECASQTRDRKERSSTRFRSSLLYLWFPSFALRPLLFVLRFPSFAPARHSRH